MQYIISRDEAMSCLYDIENTFYKKYNNMLIIKYNNHNVNSKTTYDKRFPTSETSPINIIIGVKNLVQNSTDDNVNTTDLVATIQAMFHEEHHVYQHSKLYTDKNTDEHTKDMAKIQIISTNIPEYNKMIYFKNPSEVDAELYSFQKTVEYFDTHCLNNNNVPKINARDELIKIIQNKEIHNFGWFGNTKSKDYDTVIKSLKCNQNHYKTHTNQFLAYEWNNKSHNFKKLIKNKQFINDYINCKTPQDAINTLYDETIRKFKPNTKHYVCLNANQKPSKYEIAKNKFISLMDIANKNNEDNFEK